MQQAPAPEAIVEAVTALSDRELLDLATQAGVAIGGVGVGGGEEQGTRWWAAVALHPKLPPSQVRRAPSPRLQS